MQKSEKLYSDIAPTRLRNRKEKQRKAQNLPFWTWLADRILFRMLSHRFYALRIKNLETFEQKRDKRYPCILYAPHNNWWDGIVGYNLMRRAFKVKTRMMIEELNRFPLFALIGAFPVNKASAQEAMKALVYIANDLIKDPTLGFWIFPQGIVRPPNYRPIEFQTGLTYVAQKVAKELGGVNLVPVAVNYTFLREDRPECLAEVGEPIVVTADNCNFDRHEFTKKLAVDFEKLCDEQLSTFSKGEVTGYEYVFRQDLPWNRKLEKKLKNIGLENVEQQN